MAYVERPANIIDLNAHLFSMNLGGTKYQSGTRSFCYAIPSQEEADRLASLGWNVKVSNTPDENGDDRYFLAVSVSYDHADKYPVKIATVSEDGVETVFDESDLAQLDNVHAEKIEVSIRPGWSTTKECFMPHLRTMYMHLQNNEEYAFDHRYDATPVGPNDDLPFMD